MFKRDDLKLDITEDKNDVGNEIFVVIFFLMLTPIFLIAFNKLDYFLNGVVAPVFGIWTISVFLLMYFGIPLIIGYLIRAIKK